MERIAELAFVFGHACRIDMTTSACIGQSWLTLGHLRQRDQTSPRLRLPVRRMLARRKLQPSCVPGHRRASIGTMPRIAKTGCRFRSRHEGSPTTVHEAACSETQVGQRVTMVGVEAPVEESLLLPTKPRLQVLVDRRPVRAVHVRKAHRPATAQ